MRKLFLENIVYNMLTFGLKNSVSSILEILCQTKSCTTQHILAKLRNEYRITLSLPQLYKILWQLEKEQIIIREHNTIALNTLRIKKTSDYINKAKNIYLQENVAFSQLQDGQRREFSANSLIDLDAIWNNIFTQLQNNNTISDIAFYQSHPYFILGHFSSRSSLIEQIISSQQTLSILYGNEWCLDNYGVQLVRLQWAQATCSSKTPFLSEGYNIHIIGNYILELLLPDNVTQHLKIFFDNVTSVDSFDNELYKQIFAMKWQFSFSVQHNQKQASHTREIIKKMQWNSEGIL